MKYIKSLIYIIGFSFVTMAAKASDFTFLGRISNASSPTVWQLKQFNVSSFFPEVGNAVVTFDFRNDVPEIPGPGDNPNFSEFKSELTESDISVARHEGEFQLKFEYVGGADSNHLRDVQLNLDGSIFRDQFEAFNNHLGSEDGGTARQGFGPADNALGQSGLDAQIFLIALPVEEMVMSDFVTVEEVIVPELTIIEEIDVPNIDFSGNDFIDQAFVPMRTLAEVERIYGWGTPEYLASPEYDMYMTHMKVAQEKRERILKEEPWRDPSEIDVYVNEETKSIGGRVDIISSPDAYWTQEEKVEYENRRKEDYYNRVSQENQTESVLPEIQNLFETLNNQNQSDMNNGIESVIPELADIVVI
ncbi:MAG: hypothetical protein GKR93_00105 [Gammaproteobacteria bacterium]|nr:hypothetical protein [Gammaproteobacteria bacterium]